MHERLVSERGDTLISGLLALGLVLLTIGLGAQALMFANAGSAAHAAAQEGAETASTRGTGAGVARANAILAAAGGVGSHLHPSAYSNANVVTIVVQGSAPHLFPGVDLVLPTVTATASEPLERYPRDEE